MCVETTVSRIDSEMSYVLGEITNIGSELETQFGDEGITNARLARLEQAVLHLAQNPGSPHAAAMEVEKILRTPLALFPTVR